MVGEVGDSGPSRWRPFCQLEGSRSEKRRFCGTERMFHAPGTELGARHSLLTLRPLASGMVPLAEFHFSTREVYHESYFTLLMARRSQVGFVNR